MSFRTKYYPGVFTQEEATSLFEHLKQNISWKDGIYSKRYKQVSRLSSAVNMEDNILIEWAVSEAQSRCNMKDYDVDFIYLNYYRDGNDFTPNHSHKDTIQMIISLNEEGGERTLQVGKKQYRLQNGDVIVFGSSIHGIPKEEDRQERISLATFMHGKTSNGSEDETEIVFIIKSD